MDVVLDGDKAWLVGLLVVLMPLMLALVRLGERTWFAQKPVQRVNPDPRAYRGGDMSVAWWDSRFKVIEDGIAIARAQAREEWAEIRHDIKMIDSDAVIKLNDISKQIDKVIKLLERAA